MEQSFEEYMKFFKAQPLKEKQSIILDQLKMLAGVTNEFCKELEVENDILVNRELIDVNQEDYTEDDFAEAVITYINSIQDSICDYASGVTKLLDESNGEE